MLVISNNVHIPDAEIELTPGFWAGATGVRWTRPKL